MAEAIGAAILGALGVVGATATAATAVGTVVLMAVSTALSFVIQAITPRPKSPSLTGIDPGATVMVRGSSVAHQIIFGEMVVSGEIVNDPDR